MAGMQFAVMGAGAVGCYYGGMLARAGHRVALIGRPRHVDAVRQQGLLIEAAHFHGHVPMAAGTGPDLAQGADVVLLCVKSADTEDAARALAPYLGPRTVVLSLQNGVDNAERLQAALPGQTVAAAVVYVATEMAGPGHVRHNGRGELVIGPFAGAEALAATLSAAAIPTEVSPNVAGALWAKLILNCAYNALSAVSQLPYGRLVQGVGVTAVMEDVVRECLAVAAADGVTVPGDARAAVRRIAETMPQQFSSTAQDMARGRRGEIDYLNGYVVRRGDATGVPVPANRVLHTLVRLLEDKAQAGG